MEDDDCCGGSTLVDNQQQHHHNCNPHNGESASTKLVKLLLCLPALRQADQLIRQYWTRVYRNNHQQQNTQTQKHQNMVGSAFTIQSNATDRSSSNENGGGSTTPVKMNKLFVEMLEASLR